VIVDIGERAWSQLAYQFGHELGHVLANSWQSQAKPGGPCQWLEESLVEALSLFGLGRLARTWKTAPPFPGDNAYGGAIADYLRKVEETYAGLARDQGGLDDLAAWFRRNRVGIEAGDGLNAYARAASLKILAAYEKTPSCVEALGALNRWPGRTRTPIADYLARWEASCAELGASPRLPRLLRDALRPTGP
jgi:hypothetical protein